MSMKNWPAIRPGVSVTVTPTLDAVDMGNTFPGTAAEDVLVDNPGPEDVFILAGQSSAVAADPATALRCAAGTTQPWFVGDARYVSLRTRSGETQVVTLHRGAGA
jgi:hypothetical protein